MLGGLYKNNMSFESLFKPGGEESERELAIKNAVLEIQGKISEKTVKPEIAEFFNEKDKQNLKVLEAHPDSSLNRVFQHSRNLMHLVKQTPQIIENRVRFFHPKIGY